MEHKGYHEFIWIAYFDIIFCVYFNYAYFQPIRLTLDEFSFEQIEYYTVGTWIREKNAQTLLKATFWKKKNEGVLFFQFRDESLKALRQIDLIL